MPSFLFNQKFLKKPISSLRPKHAILVILLTISIAAAGQRLPEGTFAYSTGFTYEEFTFKYRQVFEYKYSSCTGGQEGGGTYSFKKNKLVLTFENPKNKLPPQPTLQKSEPTQNDSSCLSFRFLGHKDTGALGGVTIKFINNADGKYYGTQFNSLGQATLKIRNANFPLNLEISYIGMQTKSMRVDSSGNYSIVYPLSFEFYQPLIKGDKLEFIIDAFDDDEIIVKSGNEKEFRSFTRREEH